MLLSCEELTTAAMIKPNERKAIDAEADEEEQRNELRRQRHAVKLVRQKQNQDHARQIENHSGDHRRSEQRHRRDRRHLVTAEHVFLALLHGAHARAEKSVPENAEDDHHRHHLENGRALVGIEHLGENEEESQREEIIEEEDGPISACQLQIDLEKGEKRFHSLVAEPFAGQLDEDVLERRSVEMHVVELETLGVDPFDHLDQRLRRRGSS